MIELMVAVVVLGILLALAVPSFLGLLRDARRSSAVNDLLADMTFARSEAARRGRVITACSNTSGDNCSTTNWAPGWIVFEDTDNSGTRNGSEPVIRRAAGRVTSLTVTGQGGSNSGTSYRFNPFNRVTGGTVTFCDPRDAGAGADKHSRAIIVAASGRARVEDQLADGTCP